MASVKLIQLQTAYPPPPTHTQREIVYSHNINQFYPVEITQLHAFEMVCH